MPQMTIRLADPKVLGKVSGKYCCLGGLQERGQISGQVVLEKEKVDFIGQKTPAGEKHKKN